MAPPPALPGRRAWPGLALLDLRDGLGPACEGPRLCVQARECRCGPRERLDLLGTARASLEETGIGHRAVSEGSGRVWRANALPSLLSRNPSTAEWGGGGTCAQVTGQPPPSPLHSGHSSGPGPEAREPPPPSRGSCLKAPLPLLSPRGGGEAGGLGPQSTPTLRPGLFRMMQSGRASHPEIPAGKHTRVRAHVRTHRLTHAHTQTHTGTAPPSRSPPLQTPPAGRRGAAGRGLGPPPDLGWWPRTRRRAGEGAQQAHSREEPGQARAGRGGWGSQTWRTQRWPSFQRVGPPREDVGAIVRGRRHRDADHDYKLEPRGRAIRQLGARRAATLGAGPPHDGLRLRGSRGGGI